MTTLLSGSLHLSATGPLGAEEVWERYTHPVWWPQWSPHLREVDYPHPSVTPGTSGRVTGVGGIVAVFHIDAVDEGARTWSWSVRSGPLRLAFDHGVDRVADVTSLDATRTRSDAGSTAWLVTHALWPVALGYAPVARLSLGRLVHPL